MSNTVFGYSDGGGTSYNGANVTIIESTGKGLNVRGTYSDTDTYHPSDVVLFGVSSYVCKESSTNNLPTNQTFFSLLCSGAKPFNYLGVYEAKAYDYYDVVELTDSIYFCNDILGATSADIPGVSAIWIKMMSTYKDHNALTGLATGDSHPQYLYLDGRDAGGGQMICGGASGTYSLQLKPNKAGTGGVIYMLGNIATNVTNTYNIGSSGYRFKDLYANSVVTETLTGYTASDIKVKLTDTAGVQKLNITNSLDTAVASINSQGKAIIPTISGSESSGGSIYLNSTTHSTKGSIIFTGNIVPSYTSGFTLGTSTYLMNNVHSQNFKAYAATASTSATTGSIICATGGIGCDNIFASNVKTPLISVPTGNIVIKLNDKLIINNSDNTEVASIDSNGNIFGNNISTTPSYDFVDEKYDVFQDDFRGSTLNSTWAKEEYEGTAGFLISSGIPSILQFTLTNNAGYVRMHTGMFYYYHPKTYVFSIEARIKIGTLTTGISEIQMRTAAGKYFGIRLNYPSSANWKMIYNSDTNGSTALDFTTPFAHTPGSYVYFKFVANGINSFVIQYRTSYNLPWITGGTIMSSIFTGTDFAPYFSLQGQDNAYMNIDYIKLIQARESS